MFVAFSAMILFFFLCQDGVFRRGCDKRAPVYCTRTVRTRRGGGRGASRVNGLCLFGCACGDGCLVVGAGGRPPEDEGGGGSSEDRDSESSSGVYVTPAQSPADSASSTTPDQYPTDMFLPLGPGQCGHLADRLDAHQLLTPVFLYTILFFLILVFLFVVVPILSSIYLFLHLIFP